MLIRKKVKILISEEELKQNNFEATLKAEKPQNAIRPCREASPCRKNQILT
jgi:hypothetical protein